MPRYHPICGHVATEPVRLAGSARITRCKACGLEFAEKIVPARPPRPYLHWATRRKQQRQRDRILERRNHLFGPQS